ncbi:hypothetical protein ABBQ38_012162 [Trebouxia sp. C0009 RCD-2024]
MQVRTLLQQKSAQQKCHQSYIYSPKADFWSSRHAHSEMCFGSHDAVEYFVSYNDMNGSLSVKTRAEQQAKTCHCATKTGEQHPNFSFLKGLIFVIVGTARLLQGGW